MATRPASRGVNEVAVGPSVDSPQAWMLLTDWLPEMLSELLASEIYNIHQRPPRGQRGVYLFSENGEHLYVGRTGIPARSRTTNRPPLTSFRYRFDQHTQMGKPPGAASFANRLMKAAAQELGITIPPNWWDEIRGQGAAVYQLFCEAKARIGRMECRIAAFDDDIRGVRSSVAEIYVHAHLATPFNDFSTS